MPSVINEVVARCTYTCVARVLMKNLFTNAGIDIGGIYLLSMAHGSNYLPKSSTALQITTITFLDLVQSTLRSSSTCSKSGS